VTNVVGQRIYTYIPTNQQVISTVTGATAAATPAAVLGSSLPAASYVNQRFYPYSLLASAPGVYTANTAPYIDYDGIGFTLSNTVPAPGMAPGTGTQYNSTWIYLSTTLTTAVLADGPYVNPPNINYQQQVYIL
jgi:hypothetical protein